MQTDLYDSMAEGVQGAAAVVCFMSEQYQLSENCRLELKFSKQSGVAIVPVMLESGGWRAAGWLGILTAGALWTTLDLDDMDSSVKNLASRIMLSLPGRHELAEEGSASSEAEEEEEPAVALEEVRGELDRLRVEESVPGQHRCSADGENTHHPLLPHCGSRLFNRP